MHDIVKGIGVLAVGLGVVVIVAGLAIAGGKQMYAFLGFLWIGLPLILFGAMLYCFGAIVEHLIAIRKAAERQVEIFDKLGQPKV
jgi:hypothetical protein